MHSARRRRVLQSRERRDGLSNEDFEKAVMTHGKRFFVIKVGGHFVRLWPWMTAHSNSKISILFFLLQQQYPNVAVSDLVRRFYDWKTSASYARWRERLKARKNKEAARLRQWTDPEPSSDNSDFHNEYCELCFTGGQLLCCDGCERAYHFSCVSPPIKDVPMGDWFCDNCAAVLGTTLLVRASTENEHCNEAVVDDSDDDSEPRMTPTPAVDAPMMGIDVGAATSVSASAPASTDNSDSESGHPVSIKQELVTIKEEPLHAARVIATTPSLLSPPPSSRRPSSVDNGSSNRKRQRKIVAPRRIPQPRLRE
ncbi:hypothetical protein PINS_up017446 [Pythium insidiosum]|nr:hypothetical protein PINS_up017446 [Pythium insidiosum]